MIERTQAYRVGDQTFGTLEEAQHAELLAVICSEEPQWKEADWLNVVVVGLVKHADKVIDILSTTPNSKVMDQVERTRNTPQPDLPKV